MFSPIVNLTIIHLILSLSLSNNRYLHQLDINTTFLHGDLDEDVYMKLPPDLKVPNRNNLLCQLNRSIYSLKQASRQWNQKLTRTLINLGYTQSKSDYSLF